MSRRSLPLLALVCLGATPIGPVDQRLDDGHVLQSPRRAVGGAAAFNPVDGLYLVTWTSDPAEPGLNAFEYEIFGQLVEVDGTQRGAEIRLSFAGGTGEDRRDGRSSSVVYNPDHHEFLVVYVADAGVADEDELYATRVDAATGAVLQSDVRLTHVGVDGDTVRFAASPDVAWDGVHQAYVVAYQGNGRVAFDVDLSVQRFGPDLVPLGAPVVTHEATFLSTPAAGFEAPTVAVDPSGDRVLVAGEGRMGATCGRQIFGTVVDAAGGIVTPTVRLSTPDTCQFSEEALQASAGWDDASGRFVVAYQRPEYAGDDEIYLLRWDGGAAPSYGDQIRLSATGPIRTDAWDARAPSLEVLPGGRVVVAWQADQPPGVDNVYEVYVAMIDENDVVLEAPMRITDTAAYAVSAARSAVNPAIAVDPVHNRVLVTYMTGASPPVIRAQLVEVVDTDDDLDGVPDGVDLCFGDNATGDVDGDGVCGDRDFALVVGSPPGGASLGLLAVRAPAGATVGFVGSLAGPGGGPCLPGVCGSLAAPRLLGTAVADADGRAWLTVRAPASLSGRWALVQALWTDGVSGDATEAVPRQLP